ncbi:ABC transporter permease [Frankia sp. CNm7]|uniref:ABC transporter permease n=1 Tax=Frankia nepalensis TaxID=1836974 RepID=A0A937UR02_9ACTN|nr:ABC transporter permease [Frankia nepalensis]MBL7498125.1 ABC transporter permease [Frankia nepalensis]MBL7509260.1 ABC transporter permease [Frankia nepalensis]MBL7522755.1 ABC transporter permease [Frankia nepalensis]MBL7630797.1 ABC transporter permease [Frankia nepalensis]
MEELTAPASPTGTGGTAGAVRTVRAGGLTRRYAAGRVLRAAGVVWAAYTLSFLVMELLPGDPVAAMAGAGLQLQPVSEVRLAQLREQYGFDQPVLAQYVDYLARAARGDLGDSVALGRPVTSMITTALPPTLALAASALALALVGGGALALAATYTRRRWPRQVLLSLPSLGVSLPSFWVGLMLVELLSFRARIFPAFGDDGVRGLVLPAMTLAVPTAAMIAQVLATSLLTALDEPYIQTARGKGASRARLQLWHALPNACLSTLTVAGLLVGQLLASSVVIETVFSRDGIGRITADAVTVQDIPVVQGVVVFSAVVVVITNLLIDLVYPLLDRRITLAGAAAVPGAAR